MSEKIEKRMSERKELSLMTFIRKKLSDGNQNLMQFQSKDLSTGGIFLTTENLSLFQLGEECEILIDDHGDRLVETNAKVVRGARVFSDKGDQVISGYGLMFFDPDDDFMEMLRKTVPND